MDLKDLSLGTKLVAGLGILEFLLLFIVPWHSVDLGFTTVTIKALEGDGNAVAWPAFFALIILIAVVAVTLVRALSPQTKLPDLPIGWNQAIFYGAIAIPVLLLLKLILQTDYLSFWAYILILIGAGIAYGGFLISKEPETVSPGSYGGGPGPYGSGPGAPPPPPPGGQSF
ncbi:MAG TPA: hypothetical protein VFY82_02010 [Acidimicrobiales bacterium]|nr:hypothetical protein [Acidimicrobiales bacterium]